jgi:hypothetical protein
MAPIPWEWLEYLISDFHFQSGKSNETFNGVAPSGEHTNVRSIPRSISAAPSIELPEVCFGANLRRSIWIS